MELSVIHVVIRSRQVVGDIGDEPHQEDLRVFVKVVILLHDVG